MRLRTGLSIRVVLGALGFLWLTDGCAGTQFNPTDPGAIDQPQAFVLFQAQPDGGSPDTGTMRVTLSDGTHYRGKYFQVTKLANPAKLKPAWQGWKPYWSRWTGASDWPSFRQQFADDVIANFRSTDGKQRLRCRFQLTDPTVGLTAGASGDCQNNRRQSIAGVLMPQN